MYYVTMSFDFLSYLKLKIKQYIKIVDFICVLNGVQHNQSTTSIEK